MTHTHIPADFAERVRELHGPGKRAQVDTWLAELPALLERSAQRFDITLDDPFANLSWNLVLRATCADGTPAVLKLVLHETELQRECQTLQAYQGRGGIALLDADETLGALLLARAEPGTPLSTIADDDTATRIFCDVFARLHSRNGGSGGAQADPTSATRVGGNPVSIRQHFAGLQRYTQQHGRAGDGPLPPECVERGRAYLEELITSTREEVLLHADLHHENILRQAADAWVVIDPKGVLGDPHFDVIQYLLNYEDRGGSAPAVLERRVRIMAECLGLDALRIAKWGVARGVLEACWDIEGGGDGGNGIGIADRFAGLLRAVGG